MLPYGIMKYHQRKRLKVMKWQTIGIKVPQDSDLPKRLKKISELRHLSYSELLEIWINQEEMEEPEPTLSEKVEVLSLRVKALEIDVGIDYVKACTR